MIKVVSFDIGNTLIKSLEGGTLVKQLAELTHKNASNVKQAYREHFLTRSISLDEFCERTGINQFIAIEKIWSYYRGRPLPAIWTEVPSVLAKLQRNNIKLVTISNKSYMNPYRLKSYGLSSWFSLEIYSCDIGCAKPDFCMFQHVQRLLDVEPYEILHVGDSYRSDYLGAKNSGWNSVLLERGGAHKKNMCSDIAVINTLEDLLRYLN